MHYVCEIWCIGWTSDVKMMKLHNFITLTSPLLSTSCTPLPPLEAFLPSHSRSSSTQSGIGLEADSRSSSRGSLEELPQSRHRETSSALSCGSAGGVKQKMLLDYNVYMAKYVSPQAAQRSPTATDSPGQSPESSPKTTKKVGNAGLKRLERNGQQTGQNRGILGPLVMSLLPHFH